MDIIKTENFRDESFRTAFKSYFKELGVTVRDWERLFNEMDASGSFAFVALCGEETVGFIQLQQISFESSFFEESSGFVREFWINNAYRGKGYGKKLLSLAEEYFRGTVSRIILTTDTAEGFYLKMGYVKAKGITAKNKDDVYVKMI